MNPGRRRWRNPKSVLGRKVRVAPEAPKFCQCRCGQVEFPVPEGALFRVICHCSNCQRFNDGPCADMVVYHAKNVRAPAPGTLEFGTYRPPPNVQRGRCSRCAEPAFEVLAMPLLPKLVMIPRGIFPGDKVLPGASAHMFYEHRVADAADGVPTHEGYWRSQLAFGRCLLTALLRKRPSGAARRRPADGP
jgi:hypothetical protein